MKDSFVNAYHLTLEIHSGKNCLLFFLSYYVAFPLQNDLNFASENVFPSVNLKKAMNFKSLKHLL